MVPWSFCDDGVQGRDGRCVENCSCFQIFLFVPVCILLLGSPAGLILHPCQCNIHERILQSCASTQRTRLTHRIIRHTKLGTLFEQNPVNKNQNRLTNLSQKSLWHAVAPLASEALPPWLSLLLLLSAHSHPSLAA